MKQANAHVIQNYKGEIIHEWLRAKEPTVHPENPDMIQHSNKVETKWLVAASAAYDKLFGTPAITAPGLLRDLRIEFSRVTDGYQMKHWQPDWTMPFELALQGYKLVTGNQYAKYDILSILARKHQDYGPENINKFGQVGLVIRIHDKLARLENLYAQQKEPNNESIADTWLDIVGYTIIGQMLIDGTFNLPLA